MISPDDDYVFRFKLEPGSTVQEGTDPLTDTVRIFLEDFLKVGFFTHNGERVSVDGFSWLKDKTDIHRIFPEQDK